MSVIPYYESISETDINDGKLIPYIPLACFINYVMHGREIGKKNHSWSRKIYFRNIPDRLR